MFEQQNRAVVRLFFQKASEGDLSVLDEVFTEELVFHAPTRDVRGLDNFRRIATDLYHAFADQRYTIEDELAEGEKVVTRWSWEATHVGEYMGFPATGKRVTTWGITIFRFSHGKISEAWENWSQLGLRNQLGP